MNKEKERNCWTLDVVIHNCKQEQARYLVHGYDDVLWTDDLDSVLSYIKEELLRDNKNETVP